MAANVNQWVTRLKEAFSGVGTDEEEINRVLQEAQGQMSTLVSSYPDLEDEIYDEVSGDELKQLLRLFYEVASQPVATTSQVDDPQWVSRLHDAFNSGGLFGGTDEDEVMAVLREAFEAGQIDALAKLYADRNPTELSLEDELYDELSGKELEEALKLFYGKSRNDLKTPATNKIDGTLVPSDPNKRFKPIYKQFGQAQSNSDSIQMAKFAKELTTAPYDAEDYLYHGIEVAAWLYRNKEQQIAVAFLKQVEPHWKEQFNKKLPLPSIDDLSWTSSKPETLTALGNEAAGESDHENAFFFFGVANEISVYYVLEASQNRFSVFEKHKLEEESFRNGYESAIKDLAAATNASDDELTTLVSNAKNAKSRWMDYYLTLQFPEIIARSNQYTHLNNHYNQMRSIYDSYFVLERTALVKDDSEKARQYSLKSSELHDEIKNKYSYGDNKQFADPETKNLIYPVEIAEVGLVDAPFGSLLTLYGANGIDINLSQLPGLPPPKEIGHNAQAQSLNALQPTLMAQANFLAEIKREPEIRHELGEKEIKLSDVATRQKVFNLMYAIYSKKFGNGSLKPLMELMQRYLMAFTYHTQYNVPDHGKNYFDQEFPTDLAGRQERDCGVYSMLVAWDVFNVVKHNDPARKVVFDIWSTIDHVMLSIRDTTLDEAFVINNHLITKCGNTDEKTVLKAIADSYSAVRSQDYSITPSWSFSIGTTTDAINGFHNEAWRRYDIGVRWSLKIPDSKIPQNLKNMNKNSPEYKEQMTILAQARFKNFYEDMIDFNKEATDIERMLSSGTPADDPGVITKATKLTQLIALFKPTEEWYGANDMEAQQFLQKNGSSHYLLGFPTNQSKHTIVKVAIALSNKAANKTLTPDEKNIVDFVAIEKL